MIAGRRREWLALLGALAFLAAGTVNALRKGGDFQWFLEAGRRILGGQPLYAGSGPGYGIVGPPFQAVLFVPFALLDSWSPTAARLCWWIAGLVFLYGGIRSWVRALTPPDAAPTLHLLSSSILVPVLAVLFPLQTNFEHQNLNPLLLFVLGLAALAVSKRADVLAGALVGAAVAIKAFPALLIVHLAYRRMWSAVAAALLAAVSLTLVPMVSTGPTVYLDQVAAWIRISGTGWPTRGNNQSLVAAVDRLLLGPHAMSSDSTLTAFLAGALGLGLLAVFAFTTGGCRRSRLPAEMATITLLAVLFSPIAWDHYWVLLFPAYFLAYAESAGRPWARRAFWLAVILTSALTPLTLGRDAFELVRERSPQTLAAVLVFGILAWSSRRLRAGEVADTPGPPVSPVP